MGLYRFDPFKFFAGYMHIKYANPSNPLGAGFVDIGGYVLAYVTNTAYNNSKTNDVYWTGVRYAVLPDLDLTAAYYGIQNAYGTGKQAGCSTSAHSTCSGNFRPIRSTPITTSPSASTPTSAPCTAACTTASPAATCINQHQPHCRRPVSVLM